MRRDISSTSTPNIWNITDDAPILAIFADQDFDTADLQRVLAGDTVANLLYLPTVCSVAAGILSVPTVSQINTTEDSPDNQRATYSAWLLTTNQQPILWLQTFSIPTSPIVPPAAMSWTELRIHKAGILARDQTDTYTKQQVRDLIEIAIAEALGESGILAKGVATMTAGVAAVSTVAVTPSSNIQLTGQDSGVSGTLYVSDRVPASGFTISSGNGADDGSVAWIIFAA